MKLDAADLESLRPLLRQMAAELLEELSSRRLPTEQPSSGGDGVVRLAFSEAEAAAMLGVATHVLREQRRLGRIECCRGPGRRIMYRRDQIENYLRRPA